MTSRDKEIIAQQQEVYRRKGYANREEYLEGLADDYGVDLEVVLGLAEVLGPYEDFDGLLMMLEDAAMCM